MARPKVSGNPVSKNDSKTVNTDTASTVPRDKINSQRRWSNTIHASKGQAKVIQSTDNYNHITCQNRYDQLPVDAVVSDSDEDSCSNQLDDTQTCQPVKVQVTQSVKSSRSNTVKHNPNQSPLVKHLEMGYCSKYDLPLRIKSKSISYKQVLPDCPTL